ncbi:MAG: hypothetical protein WBO37_05675, partial [Gammaproteobacteria bacterium]
LHAVASRLDELGLEPRQRVAEGSKENGYWVYLPAMERARALDIARQLEARKDHEYYIGKDNFMSLGTFTEFARAEIRLQQVKALGLDARLEPHAVTPNAYSLEFRGGAGAAGVLDDVLEENPGLQLDTISCPRPAPELQAQAFRQDTNPQRQAMMPAWLRW